MAKKIYENIYERNLYNFNYELLDSDQIVDLIREYKENPTEEVLQSILNQNYKLVASIVNKYQSQVKHRPNYDLDDLMQEGMLGLMKAIDRFDPDKGYMFSTYATHWIKQSIGRFNDNNTGAARIPVHRLQKIRALRVLAQKEGLDEDDYKSIAKVSGYSVEKVQDLLSDDLLPASLDKEVREDERGDDTFKDLYLYEEEEGYKEVLDNVVLNDLIDLINKSCKGEKKYPDVLLYRLGLKEFDGNINGDIPTLQEIADKYGVSREYIRLVERKQMKKFKRYIRIKGITYNELKSMLI